MKLKFWHAGILGIFYLVLSQPALAQEKQTKIDIGKNKVAIEEKTEKSISNILQLSEIEFPKTNASYLLTQENTTPAIIQITGVRSQQTSNGLEVILETPQGDLLTPTTQIEGNILIADIQNAVLTLPNDGDFSTNNPIEGIASITVTQVGNKVQIRITGVENAPNIRISNSQNGLTLSLDSTPQPDIELTVTAQKRPEEQQEIPLSLTVIREQEIEDAQIDSFQDIANYTPNFSFAPTSGGGTEFSNYSLRGINNANFLTAQDSVAFYIDDVPVDYNGFLDLAFTDLERIEVLRGPQSTLYGKNSSAGVVNVISRQATLEPEVTFGLSYGRYNSRELQFSINDAVVEDKLALRVAGAYRGQDGFIENLATGEKIGERARFAGRAQLLWTPNIDWTVSFNSYNSFTDDGNPTYNRINPDDPFEVNLQTEGFNKLSTNTQAVKVGYNGEGFRATSITARRYSRQENVVPGSTGGLQIIDDVNSTTWTQELRFQSPETADRLQWLLGGYYESRDFIVDDAQTEFPGFGRFRRFGDDSRETYAVLDKLTINLSNH